MALEFARAGVSGARDSLEGRAGWYPAFFGGRFDYSRDRLLHELGARFLGDEISIKPFACCKYGHNVITAVLILRNDPDLSVRQWTRSSSGWEPIPGYHLRPARAEGLAGTASPAGRARARPVQPAVHGGHCPAARAAVRRRAQIRTGEPTPNWPRCWAGADRPVRRDVQRRHDSRARAGRDRARRRAAAQRGGRPDARRSRSPAGRSGATGEVSILRAPPRPGAQPGSPRRDCPSGRARRRGPDRPAHRAAVNPHRQSPATRMKLARS